MIKPGGTKQEYISIFIASHSVDIVFDIELVQRAWWNDEIALLQIGRLNNMETSSSSCSQLPAVDPFQFFDKIVGETVAAGISIEAQETVSVKTIEALSCCDPQVARFILYNAVDPVI